MTEEQYLEFDNLYQKKNRLGFALEYIEDVEPGEMDIYIGDETMEIPDDIKKAARDLITEELYKRLAAIEDAMAAI